MMTTHFEAIDLAQQLRGIFLILSEIRRTKVVSPDWHIEAIYNLAQAVEESKTLPKQRRTEYSFELLQSVTQLPAVTPQEMAVIQSGLTVLNHQALTRKTMRYSHDCTSCVPLGQHEDFDLYFCKDGNMGIPTVLGRYGNRGEEYLSGLLNADATPALRVAKAEAQQRHLI